MRGKRCTNAKIHGDERREARENSRREERETSMLVAATPNVIILASSSSSSSLRFRSQFVDEMLLRDMAYNVHRAAHVSSTDIYESHRQQSHFQKRTCSLNSAQSVQIFAYNWIAENNKFWINSLWNIHSTHIAHKCVIYTIHAYFLYNLFKTKCLEKVNMLYWKYIKTKKI